MQDWGNSSADEVLATGARRPKFTGCPLGRDAKTLLLRTPHSLVTECRELTFQQETPSLLAVFIVVEAV